MTRTHATARRGYTLLEMVLASAISVLLLSALYVAMDVQLRQTADARDVVERATIARRLFQSMANDIAPSVGIVDPSRYASATAAPASAAPTAAAGATTGAAGATTGSTSGSTTGSTGTTGSSTTTPAPTTAAPSSSGVGGVVSATAPILGIKGDGSRLSIFTSRVPRDVASDAPDVPPGVSDVRRVSYYLAGGEASPLGLVRYEVLATTSDEAANDPPEVDDPASKLIRAPEVTSLSFRYWDGTDFVDTWDSTTPGDDGMTPLGPPAGVEITMTLTVQSGIAGVEPHVRNYRHFVAIPTANGPPQSASSSSSGASGTTTP